MRGFLGLAGHYRKFIKGYGHINKPLTELLKKDNFHWTDDDTQDFHALKATLIYASILALPDYSLSFVIEIDVIYYGIGVVFLQNNIL